MPQRKQQQSLILLALGFLMLFSFPLLSIANKPILAVGIPILYLYVFGSWMVSIILLYWIINGKHKKSTGHE